MKCGGKCDTPACESYCGLRNCWTNCHQAGLKSGLLLGLKSGPVISLKTGLAIGRMTGPPLHTVEYDFNDRILEKAVDLFAALA